MRYAFFVVEGQHDIAAIGRILREIHGANIVEKEKDLNTFWERIVPRKFPKDGYLLRRMPVPTFFETSEISVAVHSAGGDTQLVNILKNTLENLDHEQLSAIGLFCDADTKNPAVRFKTLVSQINDMPEFRTVVAPGQVTTGMPHVGIYVFPDNENFGTLENVLLDCANVSYSSLLTSAKSYIGGVDEIYRRGWGRSDESKVVVGCIANVLRPGKSNQVSIQDNDWICASTLTLPAVSILNKFIKELLEL